MSKIADCPSCGKHNCVSDYTYLNYCMWCGYSLSSLWHYDDPQKEKQRTVPKPKKPQIAEQISLFNPAPYKKITSAKGKY